MLLGGAAEQLQAENTKATKPRKAHDAHGERALKLLPCCVRENETSYGSDSPYLLGSQSTGTHQPKAAWLGEKRIGSYQPGKSAVETGRRLRPAVL